MLVVGRSARAADFPEVPFPPVRGFGAARMHVQGLQVLIEPLGERRVRCAYVVHIDMNAPLPAPMLHFATQRVVGMIFHKLQREARRVKLGCELSSHAERMAREAPVYYGWMEPRMREALSKLGMAAGAPADDGAGSGNGAGNGNGGGSGGGGGNGSVVASIAAGGSSVGGSGSGRGDSSAAAGSGEIGGSGGGGGGGGISASTSTSSVGSVSRSSSIVSVDELQTDRPAVSPPPDPPPEPPPRRQTDSFNHRRRLERSDSCATAEGRKLVIAAGGGTAWRGLPDPVVQPTPDTPTALLRRRQVAAPHGEGAPLRA